MNDAKYIGLDVHQATISVAVLDSAGKLAMEAILETKAETILQFIHRLRGRLHVTFEEGTCAAVYDDLVPYFRLLLIPFRSPSHRTYVKSAVIGSNFSNYSDVVGSLTLQEIWQLGWFFAIIKQLVYRDFKGTSKLLKRPDVRHRVSVFDPGNVTSKQPSRLLNIVLRKLLFFA
jgi:hypothetical protein